MFINIEQADAFSGSYVQIRPADTGTQALGGAVGVFLAFFIVKSLSLRTLTLVVVIVCYLTSFLFFHDAVKKGETA